MLACSAKREFALPPFSSHHNRRRVRVRWRRLTRPRLYAEHAKAPGVVGGRDEPPARRASGETNKPLLRLHDRLKGTMHMRACVGPSTFIVVLTTIISSAAAQQSIDQKVASIKDALVVLCMAGGSESTFTAEGDVELRSKLKDILSGNIGAGGGAKTKFTKQMWEGIIGGVAKDMTNIQSEQATEARKCMIDNGFGLAIGAQ